MNIWSCFLLAIVITVAAATLKYWFDTRDVSSHPDYKEGWDLVVSLHEQEEYGELESLYQACCYCQPTPYSRGVLAAYFQLNVKGR